MKVSRDGDRPEVLFAFARRLRALRRSFAVLLGEPELTRASFAAMLNLSPARYGRYERGELEPPLRVLADIRRLTGVSLDALIAGEPPGNPRLVPLDSDQVEGALTLADRLLFARETVERRRGRMATVMKVPEEDWAMWEAGAAQPPVDKMIEFCHRTGVTLDFLYRGRTLGVSPLVLRRLLADHPDLGERSSRRPRRLSASTGGKAYAKPSRRARRDKGMAPGNMKRSG